jgi:hypothetical protein
MRPLCVIGNINIDIIIGPSEPWPTPGTECAVEHGDIRVGGAAGNSALAWMAMEAPFQIVANTGTDHLGQWLRDSFSAYSQTWPIENAPTAFSVGITHPDGERTFFTTAGHLPLLSFETVERSLNLAGMRGGIALIVGGFLTDKLTANYGLLFDWLAEHDVDIALDTGWPITGWDTGAYRKERRNDGGVRTAAPCATLGRDRRQAGRARRNWFSRQQHGSGPRPARRVGRHHRRRGCVQRRLSGGTGGGSQVRDGGGARSCRRFSRGLDAAKTV